MTPAIHDGDMAYAIDEKVMRHTRIFFVANALQADAPTRLLLSIVSHVHDQGVECWFFSWSRGGELAAQIEGILGRPPVVLGSDGSGSVSSARVFRKMIATLRPHIVHAILTRPGILVPPLAKMASQAKVVVTQHGTHEWGEGKLLPPTLVRTAFRASASFMDAIVAVSKWCAKEIEKAVPSHADKILVIPNGVDTKEFSPEKKQLREQIRSKLFGESASQDLFLVGAAGNLRKIKGYDLLVEAAALLNSRENVRFVVWGDGEERSFLERRIQSLGLQNSFKLPGRAQNTASCLAACDCFVQPSRSESFGLAAAEAMASGVPVVATAVGGLVELVEDGITGLLVPPESPRALALTIQYLFDQPRLREAMGQAARERICRHFTLERMQREYLQLYLRLLHG